MEVSQRQPELDQGSEELRTALALWAPKWLLISPTTFILCSLFSHSFQPTHPSPSSFLAPSPSL